MPPPFPPAAPRPNTILREQESALRAIEAQLKDMLFQHGRTGEGRIYLFSLERVRQTLKSDWPRLVGKVHATSDWIIQHRLAADEFFIRCDEVTYIVAFGKIDEARARVKLALMSQEISQRLFGSAPAESLFDVRTAEVSADGQVMLSRSPPADERVRGQTTASSDGAVRGAAAESDIAGTGVDLSGVRFIFRPLWFVKKKVISNYLCIPVVPRSDCSFASGYEVFGNSSDPQGILALDLLALARVIEESRMLRDKQMLSLLCLPVHFKTLTQQRSRRAYGDACGPLRDDPRRVVFELVGFPNGTPYSAIQAVVQMLKPFSRSVMARLEIGQRTLAAYHLAGVAAIGIDIYADPRPEEALIVKMDEFVAAAKRNGLRAYAHGICSLSLTTAAICAGFDYVDGYAISTVGEGARDIHLYDIRQPYEHKFGDLAEAGEKA